MLLNYTFSNSFLWDGTVSISGSLRNDITTTGTASANSGTFASEARWRITTPFNGTSSSTGVQLFTSSGFTGTIVGTRNTSVSGLTSLPFNPQGQTWTFRFFESFNDGGSTVNDANWENLTVTFNAFTPPPAPTVAFDFGTLGNLASPVCAPAQSIAAGQIVWYSFTLAQAWNRADIFTTLGVGVFDTEIGLYNSNGFLLNSDDDYSTGGLGSRIGVGGGTGYEYDGPGPIAAFGATDQGDFALGSLAAGTYYIALGAFNTTFAGTGFGATSASTLTGSTQLCIIPTPSALALLGLGGLAAMRRRR